MLRIPTELYPVDHLSLSPPLSLQEDYAQLLKDLSMAFFDSSPAFSAACQENSSVSEDGKWEVPNPVKQEVKTIVKDTLAKLPSGEGT